MKPRNQITKFLIKEPVLTSLILIVVILLGLLMYSKLADSVHDIRIEIGTALAG